MRRCVFQSLTLLSLRERAGRKVKFHPKVTVIKGTNDVGKSCVLKSLYLTLGAEPARIHPTWKEADVRSLLRFTLDGTPYMMLKNGKRYTLFNGDGEVLAKAGTVTTELAPIIADHFTFRLQLQSKTLQTQATPAYLFLPFYVDQDEGWANNWQSFARLGMFSNWRKDVVEYHLGVRPNQYYMDKVEAARVQENVVVIIERSKILHTVLAGLRKDLDRANWRINLEAYRADIEELLVICNRLQRRETDLKRDLTRLFNYRTVIEAQLKITTAAAKELEMDFRFALDKVPDEIECPTCGTVHYNSFAERFEIANDEARCRELTAELNSDLSKVRTQLVDLNKNYSDVTAELEQARQILNDKQGDVTLQELIENEGRREARQTIQREIDAVNEARNGLENSIATIQRRMEGYESQDRRFRIRTQYLNRMRRYVTTLEVTNLPERRYSKMDAKITETGSDLPRGLLAYYFAILNTIAENDAATFCPIVLDSPRQQDQDEPNYGRMLSFIRDEQPVKSQLIIAVRETGNQKFEGDVVEFTEKRKLLNEADYQSAYDEIMPLIEASFADESQDELF